MPLITDNILTLIIGGEIFLIKSFFQTANAVAARIIELIALINGN